MNVTNLWDFSPGFCSFILMEPSNVLIRILLILLGIFLVYMGYKKNLSRSLCYQLDSRWLWSMEAS
jgi:hypothetical protein